MRRLDLRSWPLLAAAAIALGAGGGTLQGGSAKDIVGFCLIVIGAVCLGAWIALLASHGHTGREPPSEGDADG